MDLDIPDELVRQAGLDKLELLTALAVQLYADNRLDHAQACRLAGLPAGDLSRELISRGICVQQYPCAGVLDRRAS